MKRDALEFVTPEITVILIKMLLETLPFARKCLLAGGVPLKDQEFFWCAYQQLCQHFDPDEEDDNAPCGLMTIREELEYGNYHQHEPRPAQETSDDTKILDFMESLESFCVATGESEEVYFAANELQANGSSLRAAVKPLIRVHNQGSMPAWVLRKQEEARKAREADEKTAETTPPSGTAPDSENEK